MERNTIIELLKETLKQQQEYGYKTWEETHSTFTFLFEVYSSAMRIRVSEVPTQSELRMKYIREIRNDQEFIKDYGFPITKNSVGVKLSQDKKEIKEYIGAETSRFLKGLKNLNEAKGFYNYLADTENYGSTDAVFDRLEKENYLAQDGDESAGEVELFKEVE